MLDAHIHLTDIDDRQAARRLAACPVVHFCNSTSPADWEEVKGLAEASSSVLPFYGVHPWFTEHLPQDWEERLASLLAAGGRGIGEIGLDSLKGEPLERQKEIFERQLSLACALRKPFVLHCVRAWGDVTGALRRHRGKLPPFMAHGFGSSPQVMEELLALGGYISFWLKDLERRPEKIKPLLAAVPQERLLLETDYPNCTVDPAGDPAEEYDACLARLYAAAAALQGTDEGILKEKVAHNGAVFTDTVDTGGR